MTEAVARRKQVALVGNRVIFMRRLESHKAGLRGSVFRQVSGDSCRIHS